MLKLKKMIIQKTDSPGWTIFQQRKFGTVDFFRDWADYKHGFGSLDGDFWWGLEHLYQVSSSKKYFLANKNIS